MKTIRLTAAAALVAMAGAAFAQNAHDGHGHHGNSAPQAAAPEIAHPDIQAMMEAMMPADGDSPAVRAYKEADMRMMHGMAVPYTGNADADFRIKMIPHHQGAIDMAKVALEHATDPATREMAQEIITAQEREIAEMEAWLKANGHR